MILVTGGSGFIGGSLIRELGDEAIDLRRSSSTRRDTTVLFDLTRTDKAQELVGLLRGYDIDAIVHTASVTPWSEAVDWSLNLDMARTLVEVCNVLSVPRLIFLSGWNVYDMAGDPPFNELTPTDPDTPYGISKLETERLFESRLGSTRLVNLRAASIYGPGQESSGLITNAVYGALSQRSIEARGGDIRRDYLYIDDLTACIHKLCYIDTTGHQYINVGSGASITVRDVVNYVAEAFTRLNDGTSVELKVDGGGDGLRDNRLDIRYAQSLGLLQRTTPFEEGSKRYMEWVMNREDIL